MIRRLIYPALLSATLLSAGCNSGTNQDSGTQAPDSTALRVALLPIRECSVLQHAIDQGLARQMDLPLELIPYDALMDIDTAILSGVAHIYFEDSVRITHIKDDSLRPTLLLPIPVRVRLVGNRDKDIRYLSDLRTNMVGLTRWSQLEDLMTTLAADSGLTPMDVYHAQVNSLPVRYSMVDGGLIDAALMPQPWADSLTAQGHHIIKDTILGGMGLYMSPSTTDDSLRHAQAMQLRQLYVQAMSSLLDQN